MCVNYYSYLTTNQADSQPGWAKKDRFRFEQHNIIKN